MRKVLCSEDGKEVILIEHNSAGIWVRDNIELRLVPVGVKVDFSGPGS